MKGTQGFRLRLKVQVGRAFNTEESRLYTSVSGRQITIELETDEPPSQSFWIVLCARGFSSEDEAQDFGEMLRRKVEIAAICSYLGADTGQDEDLGHFGEGFMRELGLIPTYFQRTASNRHGLLILPDDDKTLISGGLRLSLDHKVNPDRFIDAITALADQTVDTTSKIDIPIRMLNLALINSEPLARIVLSFSAVESLAKGPSWSQEQKEYIDQIAEEVETRANGNEEQLQIAEAIRRIYLRSLRQSVKHVLDTYGLNELQREWDKLYGQRSALFHGSEQPTKEGTFQLAGDAIKLCGRIILTVIEHRGVRLPAMTNKYFGNNR